MTGARLIIITMECNYGLKSLYNFTYTLHFIYAFTYTLLIHCFMHPIYSYRHFMLHRTDSIHNNVDLIQYYIHLIYHCTHLIKHRTRINVNVILMLNAVYLLLYVPQSLPYTFNFSL